MSKFEKFLLFIILKPIAYFQQFFNKSKFKPFWIETDSLFGPVETEEKFKEICKTFKIAYPRVDIFDLKISRHHYDPSVDGLKEDVVLCSFGLRNQHIHDFDFTLRDYFNS